jgi:hypothetical protein
MGNLTGKALIAYIMKTYNVGKSEAQAIASDIEKKNTKHFADRLQQNNDQNYYEAKRYHN